MGVPPQAIMALASLAGNLFSPSKQESTASPYQAFTPEMRAALIDATQGYLGQSESIYGTPNVGPGGVSVSQTSKISPQQIKKQAFIDFRMSKGDSEEEATRKANKVVSDPNVNFRDKKGFVRAINDGQFGNLSLNNRGGIDAADTYSPGGAKVADESEMLRSFLNEINAQTMGAVSGLPGQYRTDENRALATRGALTGNILNQVGNFNELGLTPGEQSRMDSIEGYYTKKFGDLVDKTTNDFTGSVVNSGFSSSSLADNIYSEIAGKPQAEYASDVAAKLAAQYSDMLSAATGRQNTALTGSLNAFNTVGRLSGADAITAAGGSPSDFGLFNDPQAAALAAEIQQSNLTNRTRNQALYQDALGKDVTVVPTGGQSSFGAKLAAGLAGGLPMIGDAINKYLPKYSTGIKDVSGRITSNLDNRLSEIFKGTFGTKEEKAAIAKAKADRARGAAA